MKQYFILCLFFQTFVYAQIDFSKHLIVNGETLFEVTNIASDDALNVREEPRYKSAKIYQLPYKSQNIISYDKEIIEKLGKNKWVAVRIGVSEGYINGYVNAKYLKFAEVYDTVESKSISVEIPYFLNYEVDQDDWIKLYHSISFNHYSGCDERDNPELLYDLIDFEIRLKAFDGLKEALLATIINNQENLSNYYDVFTGWFHNDPKVLMEKVNYYGFSGYKYSIGAEGCGENSYFFKLKNKILVIKEPFNDNPPRVHGDEKLPKNWKFDDKDEIMRSILERIK